jgi:RNA polymerase sigma factor (sigma-70 family)
MKTVESTNSREYRSDQELVELCLQNDPCAENELYVKYYKTMYTFCYNILRNREHTKDAVIEGFSKMFKKLDTLGENSCLSSWIYTIMKHTALDILRKEKKRSHDTLKDVPDEMVPTIHQKECAPYIESAIKDFVIHRLSEQEQRVFELHAEGLSHEKISKELSITETNSRVILCRAMAVLREEFKK